MSHSQAHIEKRNIHAKQAQKESRIKRNALRSTHPIETAPTRSPPRTEKRKGLLSRIINALKKLIGR